MNWSEILFFAGIPDSPGRADAVQFALSKKAERAMIKRLPRERKRSSRNRFPSLKHGVQE